MERNLTFNKINALIKCKSFFSYYVTGLGNYSTKYYSGINIVNGDIDSGGWQLGYMMSSNEEDFNNDVKVYPSLDGDINGGKIIYNSRDISWSELRKHAFYMDKLYISKTKTVKNIIEDNIKKYAQYSSLDDVVDFFQLSTDRLNRTVFQSGHESILQIAAIGCSMKKSIFCFPWYSKNDTKNLLVYLNHIFNILELLGNMVIFPTSYKFNVDKYNTINLN